MLDYARIMWRFLSVFLTSLLTFQVLVPSVSAFTPNDTFYNRQWYLERVRADEAWDIQQGSSDVIVAVIDTGVDIYHEDLKDNIWQNADEIPGNKIDDDGNGFVDDIHGWNFVRQSNDVRPLSGMSNDTAFVHGTFVASIIAAKGNNSLGIAGIAWNAQIMPLVGLDEEGSGFTSHIANAVYYAVQNGADIINLSIEGTLEDVQLDEALAYARSHGVLSVSAAGNSDVAAGTDLDFTPVYPACSGDDGLFGVIAVSGLDQADVKASYANFGSCVDVSAPSVDIFAARPQEPGVGAYAGGFSGTSLAVPLVSGAAALLKSEHPSWGATEIRNRLLSSAVPVDDKNVPNVQDGLGAGRLDIAAALTGGTEGSTPASGSIEIFATVPGHPTRVRIESETEVIEFAPFDVEDTRGAHVSVTDVDGDGSPEIGIVPASGEAAEFVLAGRDGQIRSHLQLPGSFMDGGLVAGTSDGFVIADADGGTAWGVDADLITKVFYPYESHYKGGVDLLSVSGAAAFAPRSGGGRLVITNARGEQLVSAFPFGFEPDGRWSLARMTDRVSTYMVFSGPSGTKRLDHLQLGQLGWEDVTLAQMEMSEILQSTGGPTTNINYRFYDTFE